MEKRIGDIPIAKIFIFCDKYYLYDTYTNYIFEITREQYIEAAQLLSVGLTAYMRLNKSNKAYRDIKMLIYKGLFQKCFIQEIEHPETNVMKYLIERSVNNITLQVTRNCNFNCRYCLYMNEHGYERNHEMYDMPWEIAKKSIDYLYEHSCDADLIEISFYGGEPLLNFSLISEVVNYANSLFYSKKVVYRTTINGSLLTERVIDFFIKHDFKFTISFDGKEATQNYHRRFAQFGNETYDVVYKNIMKIKEINADYFKSNVSFIAVAFNDENRDEVISFFQV